MRLCPSAGAGRGLRTRGRSRKVRAVMQRAYQSVPAEDGMGRKGRRGHFPHGLRCRADGCVFYIRPLNPSEKIEQAL